jgi:HD-like signal output (HDOD) protein
VALPEGLTARISALPTMPRAAREVLERLRRPDVTAHELQEVIETDPGLAGSVLRLANSSLFGPPRPTTSLSHAIVLIGLHRLRALTLTAVVSGLRALAPAEAASVRDLIWRHSVDVALAARLLAVRLGLDKSEEAFIAGLMHDCGRLVLLVLEPEGYRRLVRVAGGVLPTSPAEKSALGFTHEETGAALIRQWGLAPQLVLAAGSHHGPHSFEGPHGAIVALTAFADRMMEPGNQEPIAPVADSIGLDTSNLDALRDEIEREVAGARAELLV